MNEDLKEALDKLVLLKERKDALFNEIKILRGDKKSVEEEMDEVLDLVKQLKSVPQA